MYLDDFLDGAHHVVVEEAHKLHGVSLVALNFLLQSAQALHFQKHSAQHRGFRRLALQASLQLHTSLSSNVELLLSQNF